MPDASADASSATACDPSNFKIALDVGHTPEAPGATSSRGVMEYTFNLQLAKQVDKTLQQAGFRPPVLITERGRGRSQLLARAERASAIGADLFLSIHHDDVQDVYHAKWTHNGAAHIFSDKFSGYSLFISRDNIRFDDSLRFAQLLGGALKAQGMRYSDHHAEPIAGEGRRLIDTDVGVYLYDELVVLRYNKVPAVLLEAGVIVNRTEEVVVSSPEGREQISAAVLDAARQYCAQLRR
jgi:N-acetylmuramoyl-L-alanine amidase